MIWLSASANGETLDYKITFLQFCWHHHNHQRPEAQPAGRPYSASRRSKSSTPTIPSPFRSEVTQVTSPWPPMQRAVQSSAPGVGKPQVVQPPLAPSQSPHASHMPVVPPSKLQK